MGEPRLPNGHASEHAVSGEFHPFLTERGLRLQRNSRVDLPQGVPLPSSVPGGKPQASDDSNRLEPPLLSQFENAPLDPSVLQNLRAAKRFPDLAELRRRPLTSFYRSALATDSIWNSLDTGPRDKNISRAIGKLVIRLPGKHTGPVASGSAFVIGPNTIMTCAHNLFDSNERKWSAALEFYPGYDFYSDRTPPVCRVVSAVIPAAYLDNPLSNHDMAVCRVDINIGEQIGTELPVQPIKDIGFFDAYAVDIMGYPAGSGFDFGKQLWRSRGRFLFGTSGGGDDDYAPAIATDFGGGASGCPWVYFHQKTGRFFAVGITSGHAKLKHDLAEPNLLSLTSPLFSSKNLSRLNDDFVEHRF